MELAVAAAPADPDRLGERPPFPPPAERCAFMWVLSIKTSAGGPPAAARAANKSCHTPFAEPVVERLARSIASRRIDPAPARLHDMDDPADDPPVIDTGDATYLVRQQRLKPLKLPIAQPKLAQILAPDVAELESHPSRKGNPVYGS